MRNLPSSINPSSNRRGSTLILALIVIIVLAVCVGAAVDYTLQSYRFSQRNNARRQALAAADGVLEQTYIQWRATCEAQGNVTLSAASINAALSAPSFTSVLQSATNGAGFLSATPVLSDSVVALNATDPNMIPITTGTPVPSQAGGPNLVTYDYLATAKVGYTSLKSSGNEGGAGATSSTNSVTVCRVYQKAYSSPWLYAIAYNDDLEINPGASLILSGAVETNANLYSAGGGSSNPTTFNAPVYYAGTYNTAWSPNDYDHSGTPVAATFGNGLSGASYSPPQTPENASLLAASSSNPNASDGYHEIIDVPNSSYSDPLASTNVNDPSERIFNQAGIIVQINSSTPSAPVVSIYEGSTNYANGTQVTAANTDAVGKAMYTAVTNALTTTTTTTTSTTKNGKTTTTTTTKPVQLYDGREQTTVNLVQLDVSKLYSVLNTGGALSGSPYNIIYIYDTSYTAGSGAAPANQTGPAAVAIQLINGSNIPANGLTIASENPVYVVGDYNTGGTGSAVPSNNSTTGNPQASGYTWEPCAIMADSVTVLSSNWTNSASAPSSIPNATNTTVNAAFLSGIVTSAQSGSGQSFVYSGGAENFIRLLQNWSGDTLTYYGSMEELFKSKEATGVWQATGAYYQPPTREWHFDLNFYNSLPPGTFTSVSYLRGRYYMPQ